MPLARPFHLLPLLCAVLCSAADGQDIRRLPPLENELPPFPVTATPHEEALATRVAGPTPLTPISHVEPFLAPVPPEVSAELLPMGPTELMGAPVVHWYSPSYWFGPAPWDSGIELGLNGSSGSSDSISTRAGGFVKRKTERGKLDTSIYHNRTKGDDGETQNNAQLTLRYDWLLGGSPWSVYLNNQTFYDRFQAYDLNVNVNSGVGYDFVDEEYWKFSTSLGAGASRKLGGVRDEWVPEAQAGFNWEQRVSDTQKFVAKLDYFPQFEYLSKYRLVTDIGWEIELSRPSNVSLKISLTDRFDSVPDGVNPHNTNYSVLLIWKK